MPIKKIKPFPDEPVPYIKQPRCDADVSQQNEFNKSWRTGRYEIVNGREFQCSRPAVVVLGEKNYCRLHGGHIVLNMYLEGKLIDV